MWHALKLPLQYLDVICLQDLVNKFILNLELISALRQFFLVDIVSLNNFMHV
jgi:hypothetical protein